MEIIDQLEQGPRGVYSGALRDRLRACLLAAYTPSAALLTTCKTMQPYNALYLRLDYVAPSPCAGSLGYISFNDTFDLNIVIRTAVLQHDRISIGAGGAIVVQSGEHSVLNSWGNLLTQGLGTVLDSGEVCRPLVPATH